ncbi:MAG: lamin tail domain-containing protein [Candidatus Pacebacteria bacterium]|nr:lamin tail domain-containing protein [Candidatus Paceibacterota bacterium]
MKKNKFIIFLLTPILIVGIFLIYGSFILASEVDYIVISKIQIGGKTVYDEFIELYNPTDQEINLENWDLKRKTKSGSENNMLNNIEGIIPAYGYFLIVPRANCGSNNSENCYNGFIIADDKYTTNSFLAKNNTILLYDDNKNLVDKVGWGEAGDFEGKVININPENNQSLERININGIVQDLDNNKNDFILRDNLGPQNSSVVNNQENIGQNNKDQEVKDFESFEHSESSFDQDAKNNNDSEKEESTQESGPNDEDDNLDKESKNDADNDNSGDNSQNDYTQDSPIAFQDYKASSLNNSMQENGVSKKTHPNSSQGGNKIIIMEFLPNPEDSDRDNEFIEIYNDSDVEADLSGWILEDKIGKIKKFVIPFRTEISAGKYKVFYSDETKIILNNSGDGVVLRDDKNNIIDETSISGSVQEEQSYILDKNGNWVLTLRPTPGRENIIKAEEKIIFEKVKEFSLETEVNEEKESDSKASELDFFSADRGEQDSSTQENKTNTGYNYSDRIVISEIYPNPFGRDNREGNYEWIELYNNSDENVNLRGWQIDDILEKGSSGYIIKEDKIIKARNFAVFENIQTKIILNNPGDEVNIFWPDGKIIDNIKYKNASEGFSYNRTTNSWAWSKEITPEKNNKIRIIKIEKKLDKNDLERSSILDVENIKEEPSKIEDIKIDYLEANIKDIKHFLRNSRIKVSGVISTPPGIFADNIFYLSGSGIQVYSYKIKVPEIELGDKIEIIGKVSEVGGEKRILIDNLKNIKILSRNHLIEAQLVLTGNINESVEGYLVVVEGKVSQIKKDVFYLNDGSGEVKIYIKPQTQIEKLEIKKDDWMTITGQVSQTSLGYRILPRFQGDVKLSKVSGISTAQAFLETKEIKEKNENTKNKNLLRNILFFMIITIVLIDWIKMKIKNHK